MKYELLVGDLNQAHVIGHMLSQNQTQSSQAPAQTQEYKNTISSSEINTQAQSYNNTVVNIDVNEKPWKF